MRIKIRGETSFNKLEICVLVTLQVSRIFYYFIFYYVWCFACIHACEACDCMVPVEAKRGHWILWNWSYYSCEPRCGCLLLNLGLLEDEQVLLTAEPSFSNLCVQNFCFHIKAERMTLTKYHIFFISLNKGNSSDFF